MSSALSLIVLGQAYVFGAVPDALPTTVPNNFNLIPANINGSPSQPTPTLDTEIKRPDYTYTAGVGAHRVSPGVATWNAARRACEDQGSHLAIINSVAEAEAVAKLLKKSNERFGYLGLHDLYQEDDFVTIHGESLAQTGFDTWNSGEPNNANNNENCVVLSSEGKLNDVPCGDRHHFICEIPHVQSYVVQVPIGYRPAVARAPDDGNQENH